MHTHPNHTETVALCEICVYLYSMFMNRYVKGMWTWSFSAKVTHKSRDCFRECDCFRIAQCDCCECDCFHTNCARFVCIYILCLWNLYTKSLYANISYKDFYIPYINIEYRYTLQWYDDVPYICIFIYFLQTHHIHAHPTDTFVCTMDICVLIQIDIPCVFLYIPYIIHVMYIHILVVHLHYGYMCPHKNRYTVYIYFQVPYINT